MSFVSRPSLGFQTRVQFLVILSDTRKLAFDGSVSGDEIIATLISNRE